jgi:hypothetical protein
MQAIDAARLQEHDRRPSDPSVRVDGHRGRDGSRRSSAGARISEACGVTDSSPTRARTTCSSSFTGSSDAPSSFMGSRRTRSTASIASGCDRAATSRSSRRRRSEASFEPRPPRPIPRSFSPRRSPACGGVSCSGSAGATWTRGIDDPRPRELRGPIPHDAEVGQGPLGAHGPRRGNRARAAEPSRALHR